MKLAFLFRTAPQGTIKAREGLEALLAATAFCEEDEIGVFFQGDGIFNLIAHQSPEIFEQKDFLAMWKLLDLYEIKNRFVCNEGQTVEIWQQEKQIEAELLSNEAFYQKLQTADKILTF